MTVADAEISPPSVAAQPTSGGGNFITRHKKLIVAIVVIAVLFPILGSIGGVLYKMWEILQHASQDVNDLLSVLGRLLDWVEQQCEAGKWYICWPGIIGIIGLLATMIFPGFRAKIGQKFTDLISRMRGETTTESDKRVAESSRRGKDEAVGEFTRNEKRPPTPAEIRVIEVRVIIVVLKTEAADAVVSSGKLAAEGAALAEAFQAADAVRKASEDAARADGADINAVDAAVHPDPEIPRVA